MHLHTKGRFSGNAQVGLPAWGQQPHPPSQVWRSQLCWRAGLPCMAVPRVQGRGEPSRFLERRYPRKARKPGVWRGKTKLGAVWGDGRGPGRGPRTPADVRLSFMAGMSPVVLEVWWPLGSGIARVLEVGRTAGLSSGVCWEHRWPRNMSHNPQGLQ